MSPLTHSEKTRIIQQMSAYIPHARELGIRLEAIVGEEVTLRLPYRANLVGNPETGAIHSGVLTVLLDQTLGTAGICCDAVGATITPTLDLRIDHLGVAPAGRDILATARVYKVTRRILFVEGYAWCESRDKPVARASGSWVLMRELDLKKLWGAVDAGAQQQ
ncbi:MAG: PaaI family thioesterase [Gammaproteobacteria bacterium]|nr:PaaI family thioesterase [Gammaproteobacteria bacterium]MDH5170867.1 PaaI family thioesterase [Gammaproteobacteria bacterium]